MTFQLILTLAATWYWPVKQLDMSNTFLNGPLHEAVYSHSHEALLIPHDLIMCVNASSILWPEADP